ncbi:MAG: hypothetical protein LC687_00745 [Actinobacteria bacterium]|nr:hypothetical protein [Actinomycetota bacterium]
MAETTLREFIEWLQTWKDPDNIEVHVPGIDQSSITSGATPFDKDNLLLWELIPLKHDTSEIGGKDILILGQTTL